MTEGAARSYDRPVLFHVHGIGEHDFSSMRPDDLKAVQAAAMSRCVDIVPTIFLRQDWLSPCEAVLARYDEEHDRFPNILGFAIEGPLLGPSGGTPRSAAWMPTVGEWRRIAGMGKRGLRYLVLAPDSMETTEEIAPGFRLIDLVEALSESGVRVALGHFERVDPPRSADRALGLIEAVHQTVGSSRFNVLTDHLYNDMPRNFVHAWRGEAQERRDLELQDFLQTPWTVGELAGLLGPVPAALLEAAREGRLLPCMNFDGHHVDLAICQRTVDYLGPENLIAITDHTETHSMAGEDLHAPEGASLWYRDDEVVAAGRKDLAWQVENMRRIGIDEAGIHSMTIRNPHLVIELSKAMAAA